MSMSFITPNRKSFISHLTYNWLLCFCASSMLLGGLWLLFDLQLKNLWYSSQDHENQIKVQQIAQEDLKAKFDFLNLQVQKIEEIQQKNKTLMEGITNLLNLIPEQITINSIYLEEDKLTIKGITPSKELYIFLLEAPLKAIFDQSNVDFFVLPSGWYNFVSVSKTSPYKGNK